MGSFLFQEKIRKYIQRRGCKIKKKTKPKQTNKQLPKPVLNVAEATRILSSYRHSSKITDWIFFLAYNLLLPSVVITNTYL